MCIIVLLDPQSVLPLIDSLSDPNESLVRGGSRWASANRDNVSTDVDVFILAWYYHGFVLWG